MNTTILFKQFSNALNWNTYYYLVYKCSFTIRTILLYSALSTHDFSTWATINSTIFLILLWADCGLRKSIPRYAPIFHAHRRWFFSIMILMQISIITLTLPLLIWFLRYSTTHLLLIIIGIGIFIAEGIQNTIKLMYHAYFDNKSFNSMAMSCTSLEMILTLCAILLQLPSYSLLITLFIIKLISSWLLVGLSTQYTQKLPPQSSQTSPSLSLKPFAFHSLIMWGTTILKSLSERNFLVPFFTQTMGPISGNLFKVANDGALLGYRLILKTIGSADTALLAHMHEGGDKNMMDIAVKKLIARIARLCIPLLGILGLVSLYKFKLFYKTPFVFHAFLIMGIGYIIETTLLPYERVLEVKRNYRVLLVCYIPYVCMLFFLISGTLLTSIGFINTLTFIHGVRLVSCIMMRGAVYRIYGI